ncbi:nitrate reductase molybdenum cofactor assembly chaperone [Acinetobacter gerneri]|uniref:nitrate reductase molybdenum cofactor assembly chaperone n=1 Tax=Acinetobacter gerneri TaxID=202952 RepID=UPI0028AD88FF|nr:nitrate reductase molybdenum cofactor assembly chaperone [Acinetobacter gerneri]
MNPYKLLSVLLSYPSTELQQALLTEISFTSDQTHAWQSKLKELIDYLTQTDLITIQENYVTTFDRNSKHSLHLFEHLHGEHRDRGDAMVNLLHEYQAQGFEPTGYELPDYLPLFLEFLSLQDENQAADLLSEAVHVIQYIADKLHEHNSIYASVLDLAVNLSPIAPVPLKVTPIRDMDEALEIFGPNPKGIEPLLNSQINDVQIIKISPSQKRTGAI